MTSQGLGNSDVVQSYLDATQRLSHKISSHVSSDLEWCQSNGPTESPTTEDTSDSSDCNGATNDVDCVTQETSSGFQFDENMDDAPPTATFTTRGQSRTGSHHGRGGRRAGSGFRVREKYLNYATTVLCGRMYALCADAPLQTVNMIVSELKRHSELEGDIEHLAKQFENKLGSKLEELSGGSLPYTVERLPFSVLGVSARFTKSDALLLGAGRMANCRERHIVNTWLDAKGRIRCTCIGSTQFSILSHNDGFQDACCDHAESFISIFNRIGQEVFNIPVLKGKVLYECFSALQPALLESLRNHLPLYTHLHKDQSALYVNYGGIAETTWVPIRCVQRKGIKFLCALCDLMNTNSCAHIQKFSELLIENGDHTLPVPEPEETNEGEVEQESSSNRSPKYPPISYRPVAPVNCPFALKRDLEICDMVKANGVFVIPAPYLCVYCDSPRLGDTKETNTSGVILCTMGACRMEIHTYKCSSCNRRFSAEGRQEGIFLESICTAATHVLLRDELIGFAQGNGTMSSRLNQLHSKLSSIEDSEMFANPVPCKSTKTLYSMCIAFARLMVMDPPKSLFWCTTCQRVLSGIVSVPRTVCVDGIWAGYLKKSSQAFQNVSVPCKGKANSKRTRKNYTGSSRTTLVRLEKTVSFLLQAIKGEKIEITVSNLKALVAAVKVVNETVLPSDFHASSVCGIGPTDYHDDIGDVCLPKLRQLTCSLFDERTLLYRMLKPLQEFFERKNKRRRKPNRTSSSAKLKDILCDSGEKKQGEEQDGKSSGGRKRKNEDETWRNQEICTQAISQLGPFGVDTEDRVPWNPSISMVAGKDDLGKHVLNLFKCLVQGPVTHLVRRKDLPSVCKIVNCCEKNDPDGFMEDMLTKERFKVDVGEQHSGTASNVAETLRILTGGLFCAAVIDKKSMAGGRHYNGLLGSFSNVLTEVVRVVKEFYIFCDAEKQYGTSTAAEYARRWSSMDSVLLRSKFIELSNSESFQDAAGVDYDDKYTTGTFFPSFPQIRPLPFHDEGRFSKDELLFGFCTKHYLQKNGSFTPGAVTFCCSCPHPILIGFKVLEWDEGPRAILDALISRFPTFPRFIVYDFACGVYKSAFLPLWWAVEDSTLVSDPFHGCNHKCSPAFLPTAHTELNMMNTIAHEQRNRPIAHIKHSLQQTSQDVYITLLAYQGIINNIEAKTRTTNHTQEAVQNRSAKDIEWGYFSRLKLKCQCCEARVEGFQGVESNLEFAGALSQSAELPESDQGAHSPEGVKEE